MKPIKLFLAIGFSLLISHSLVQAQTVAYIKINGPTTVSLNSQVTYHVTFHHATGQTLSPPQYSYPIFENFTGGTIISQSNLNITIKLTQPPGGQLRYSVLIYDPSSPYLWVPYNAILQINVLPSVPVATSASQISTNSFTANWNNTAGATGYRLDVATNSAFTSFVSGYQNLAVTGNSLNVTGLSAVATYYYRVRATNTAGTSANSNTITVLTTPGIPPAYPATSIATSSFTANWGSVSGATGYRLDVSTTSNFSSYVNGYYNLAVTGTSRNITGLSPGTTYFYRLRASNSSGASGNSTTIPTLILPAAPTPSVANNISANSFTANWNSVTSATHYLLDVSPNTSFSSFVPGYHNLNVSSTNAIVTGLSAGTPYYYRIRAVNTSGTSSYSSFSSTITIPPAPVANTASNINLNSFNANWDNTTGATHYRIDVSTVSNFSNMLPGYTNLGVGAATSLNIVELDAGTTYYYRVRAENGSGISSYSNTITAVTKSPVPSIPTADPASNITATSFTANWSSVSGALSYELDISTTNTFNNYVSGYQGLPVPTNIQNVTGLSSGTTYYYRVRSVSSGGISGNSNISTVSIIPPAPVGNGATETNNSSFNANWTNANGATGYRFDLSTSITFSSMVSGYNNRAVSETNLLVTGLSPNINYYYRIRAENSGGTSVNSNSVSALTAPAVPATSAPTNYATTSFTANWATVTGATGYRLDVSTSSNFTSFVSGFNNLLVTTNSRSVTGLAAGNTYFYRVRSVNAGGSSLYSDTRSALTISPVPTLNAATNNTTSSFTASWNNSTSATSYLLDVSASSVFSNFVSGYQNRSVTGNSHNVTGLAIGTKYYFRIRAVNGSGNSPYSAQRTTATLTAAPGNAAASGITANSFIANWNSVSGATGYRLDVSTNPDFSSFVSGYNNLLVTETNKTVVNLAGGITYHYRIRAVNEGGASTNSGTSTALTIPSAPVFTAATSIGFHNFTLNWNAALGAASYQLDVAYDNTFTHFVAGYSNLIITESPNKVVTGLSPNTTYYCRVRAVNSSGTSINSTTQSVKTQLTFDYNINWSMTTAFDVNGNIVAQSKAYSDGTGKILQVQAKDVISGQVLATQPLYDAQGAAVGATLPAPIMNTAFGYKSRFLTNLNGEAYSVADFDVDRNNPAPVSTEYGTVGWYYSQLNDMDPFIATTSYPYSRSWTEAGPDPKNSASAGPGDAHRMGAGKEAKSKAEKVTNDPQLIKYYSWRLNFVSEPVALQKKNEGYKITSVNPDGKESVAYMDAAGNTVISGIKNGSHYEYAFVYYDDVGNVVAEIAPRGVEVDNPAKFVTKYKYNHQGWLLESSSWDEGISEYVYSFDGKIRFSQNAQQKTDNKFSYTNYDYLGRLIESGEYRSTGSNPYVFQNHYTATPSTYSILHKADLNGSAGALDATRCSDVTKISYDLPDPQCPETQRFLYGNVSSTKNTNVTSWYSYDDMGRLEWMIQDIQGLGQKKVAYTYDFMGNVLQVAYQVGHSDAFYHHYEYDASQRLEKVFTSKNGSTKKLQAAYYYNLLGALIRVELAENLQGIDYTYNVNGWLKTINHGDIDLDPGMDGQPGSRQHFKKDAFGMTIEYHPNDYSGAGYNSGNYSVAGVVNSHAGSIKAIGWHNGSQSDQVMYKYGYDEKYQLTSATWGNVVKTGGAYNFVEAPNKYTETITGYDRHGNIQALNRKDGQTNPTANFTYQYVTESDKLDQIKHDNNLLIKYTYNAIGQMTRQEEAGNTMAVEYNAYGLVSTVKNGEGRFIVQFAYDDRGDRITKKTYDRNFNLALDTWYVRDAGGNILAVYTKDYQLETELAQTEVPVYGAGRIGMYMPDLDNYLYEITDHLGNVRSVIAQENIELEFMATMEIANADEEEGEFVNIPQTRHDLHNHTPGGSYSAWLNGSLNRVAGPGMALRVNPGDTIQGEVYAKYLTTTNGNTGTVSGLAALIAGAFGYTGTAETQPIFNLFNQALGGGALFSQPNTNVPKAYIVALYFNNNFGYEDASYHVIGTEGLNAWQKLTFEKIVEEPGYVYIYVANESRENINVFFDDLKVTMKQSLVVSGNDYYPFGMPIAERSFEREDYRFDYQGQFSEKDDETGWNAFQLRMYDARIGRWISTDPYGQYHSPYVGMGNKPMSGVDPDGGWSWVTAAVGAGIGGIAGAAYGLATDKKGWGWYALGGGVAGGLLGGISFKKVPVGGETGSFGIGWTPIYELQLTDFGNILKDGGKGIGMITKDLVINGRTGYDVNNIIAGWSQSTWKAYYDRLEWARSIENRYLRAAMVALVEFANPNNTMFCEPSPGIGMIKVNGFFRGGASFKIKPNEVKIDPFTKLIKTSHGVSVHIDPNKVAKFGGAYKIHKLPKGLKIIQRGTDQGHFEIVPEYDMTLEQFQKLLDLIEVLPVK